MELLNAAQIVRREADRPVVAAPNTSPLRNGAIVRGPESALSAKAASIAKPQLARTSTELSSEASELARAARTAQIAGSELARRATTGPIAELEPGRRSPDRPIAGPDPARGATDLLNAAQDMRGCIAGAVAAAPALARESNGSVKREARFGPRCNPPTRYLPDACCQVSSRVSYATVWPFGFSLASLARGEPG